MTPSEKYNPWYSRIVYQRLIEKEYERKTKRDGDWMDVVEVGGGNGTMALEILRLCKRDERKIRYNIVEISGYLVERQKEVLKEFVDGGSCVVHNADATAWDGWDSRGKGDKVEGGRSDLHILAFEVLDNLPHDKVRFVAVHNAKNGRYMHTETQQCFVTENKQLKWMPVKDNDVIEAISVFGYDTLYDAPFLIRTAFQNVFHQFSNLLARSGTSSDDEALEGTDRGTFVKARSPEIWAPTSLYMLLKNIAKIDHHRLTISDFTHFPDQLPGINGPVVQTVNEGKAVVYDSVEKAPPGKVDVLFPTDFERLRNAYATLTGNEAKVWKHEQFVNRYEKGVDIPKCKDGYSPIHKEFGNAAVLLGD